MILKPNKELIKKLRENCEWSKKIVISENFGRKALDYMVAELLIKMLSATRTIQ